MADEQNQTPPDPITAGTPLMPPTSRQVTTGLPPEPLSESRFKVPEPSRPRSELENFGRWALGVFLIVACGWGLLFFGYWITGNAELGPLVSGVISLGLFLWIEQDFWLSRFMGLHISPNSSPLKSAIFMWLLGLVYLFLRSTIPQQAAVASEGSRAQASKAPMPQNADGPREIIETVVFVVVLVLLLKTFLAEAFVIPTGSMAPTLLGYHKNVKCEKCGYPILVNASSEVEDRPPDRVREWQCPNCRYIMHLRLLKQQQQEDAP